MNNRVRNSYSIFIHDYFLFKHAQIIDLPQKETGPPRLVHPVSNLNPNPKFMKNLFSTKQIKVAFGLKERNKFLSFNEPNLNFMKKT